MAWDGYFEYDNVEIINATRTAAYVRSLGLSWVHETGAAPDLPWLLGQNEYVSPSVDTAPWYDPDLADSVGFAGIIPLSVVGLEDSTREARGFDYTTDGGNPGRIRHGMKEIAFNVALIGDSDCAVEYGFRWLKRALLDHQCTPGLATACSGERLVYSRCFPEGGRGAEEAVLDGAHADTTVWDVTLEGSDDPSAQFFDGGNAPGFSTTATWSTDFERHLRNVTFPRGPVVTGKRQLKGCGGAVWLVSFTARAGDPFEYGERIPLLRDLGQGGDPYVPGFPSNSGYSEVYEWTGTPDASASEKVVNGDVVGRNMFVSPKLETGYANHFPVLGSASVPDGSFVRVTATGSIAAHANFGLRVAAAQSPTVIPGQTYTVSVNVRSAKKQAIAFSWLNASQVFISASVSPTKDASGSFTRISHTATAPAGAHYAQITFGNGEAIVNGDIIDIRNARFAPASEPDPIVYFDGDTPDVIIPPTAGATTYTAAPCSEPIYAPIYDPLYPALVTPPPPPNLIPGGFEPPTGIWSRAYAEIPASVVPQWDEVRPYIVLRSIGGDARMIRIRFFDASASPSANCAGAIGEFILSYVPQDWNLVIDAASQEIYVTDDSGTMSRPAESLAFGSVDADPVRWFGLSCGGKYLVTLDWKSDTSPDLEMDLDLIPRSA